MKIYIVCQVPAQILYWEKSYFWDMGQNAHKDCSIFNSLIFLHVDTNSQKLKVNRKFFGWAWSKMGVANMASRL